MFASKMTSSISIGNCAKGTVSLQATGEFALGSFLYSNMLNFGRNWPGHSLFTNFKFTAVAGGKTAT